MIAALIGSLNGLALGSLGGIGTILTIPLLVYCLNIPIHNAVIISLCVISVTALLTLVSTSKTQKINWGMAFFLSLGGILSAPLGARLGETLSETNLMYLVSLACCVSGLSLLAKKIWYKPSSSQNMSFQAQQPLDSTWPLFFFLGNVCGFINGLIGIGFGFILVPALILLGKQSAKLASSLALIIIIPISAVSLLTHLSLHVLNSKIILFYILGSTAGLWISQVFANAKLRTKFQPMFAAFLICLAVFMSYTQATRSKRQPVIQVAQSSIIF